MILDPGLRDAVELDLDDDDAKRPSRAVDPSREIEAGASADAAQREEFGRARRHRLGEIVAVAIIMAEKAVGAVRIRRGDRHPLCIERIDDRCTGARREQRELGVERRIDRARREGRADIGIFAEHDREQAVGLQFRLKQPQVAARLLHRPEPDRGSRIRHRPPAIDGGDHRDDHAQRGERHQHRQRGRHQRGSSPSHLCGLSHRFV